MKYRSGLVGLVSALSLVGLAGAQTSGTPISIGMSVPLTSGASAYGQGLAAGAKIAVARANAMGGISGRQLELVVLDDAGDPQRAATNARQLIQHGVVALTGIHGARSASAVAELLAGQPPDARPALVAPATSTDNLRDPARPGVFHLRAGIVEEVSSALLHLDTIGLTRYAVVSQADPLGDSGREGIELELSRIGIRPIKMERIERGATLADATRAMERVCTEKPEAIVLALDAEFAAAALNSGRTLQCAGQYVVFSEAGAALAVAGMKGASKHPLTGLLVTQVVPHPNNLSHPLVSEYRRSLAQHGSGDGSYPSLEGYMGMRVIQEAVRSCVRELTRPCITNVLENRTIDIPGIRVRFGAAHRQPKPYVEITLLDREGKFRR